MHQTKTFRTALGILVALLLAVNSVVGAEQCLVYVGTFTGAKSKGIYAYRMDLGSGKLTSLGLAAETASPAFLEVDAQHKFLYAVNEISTFEGKPSGAVSAFSIDAVTGKLSLLNQSSTVGAGPCHLALDRTGRNVLVANYGGGSVAVLPVGPDGKLGQATDFIQDSGRSVDPARQEGPHAHCMTLDAANRFVFACDLGLDKIFSYHFDAQNGKLSPNEPPFAKIKPGFGPRHFVFHPDGRHAYLMTEMAANVVAFDYDAEHGALKEVQTISTLPDDYTGKKWGAEIAVHPSGKFLYVSNRAHDSIAVFAIDPMKGTLTLVEHQSTQGKTPRYFGIAPGGKFLLAANQDSDTVVVFGIDGSTGKLKPTGETLQVASPVCVRFVTVN